MPELIQDVDWYLTRLEGVEGGQGEWSAWCPCHDDVGTSVKGLSISVRKGRVYGNCHSPHCGANLLDVFNKLEGFDPDEETVTVTRVHASTNGHSDAPVELPEPGRGMTWWIGKTGVPQEIWESLGCHDHEGGVAFHFGEDFPIKIRKPPKEIIWQPKGAEVPPLWPIPSDELPEHISITEGESDCGTAHAAGMPYAFSVTSGAKTPLPSGWATALAKRGVKELTLVGDADESGETFTARMARESTGAGLTTNVVRLDTVLDPFSGITDLNGTWRACETIAEFQAVIERATQRIAVRIPFMSVAEIEVEAEREIEWLIPDLIAPGDKIMLAAPQKSLKSWIALELTRSLVTGSAFLKRAEWVPNRTLKVGFIQEEGSKGLWARRVHMLNITGNEQAFFAHKTGFKFTDPSFSDEVISSAREQELDMLIFDPMQRMVPGVNMNDDSETGVVWDEVFRIQQALPHLVVMIVHHANKHNRLTWDSIRGSSRHAGEVDLGLFLERHPMQDATLRMWLDGRDIPQYLGTGEAWEVKYKIDRDTRTAEFDATEIQVVVHTAENKGKQNRDKVHAAVAKGHNTRTKIIQDTDLSDNTIMEHLKTLVEAGDVVETDNGPGKPKNYTLPEGA